MTVNLPKSESNFRFDDDLRPIGRRKFTVKSFISLRISIGRRNFVVEILCRRWTQVGRWNFTCKRLQNHKCHVSRECVKAHEERNIRNQTNKLFETKQTKTEDREQRTKALSQKWKPREQRTQPVQGEGTKEARQTKALSTDKDQPEQHRDKKAAEKLGRREHVDRKDHEDHDCNPQYARNRQS
jgi:hypothetical protein